MLIDIHTNDPVFAETVANVLRDSGHAVLVRDDGTESYGLQHPPGLPADELVGLLEALAPLAPLPCADVDSSGDRVRLLLGDCVEPASMTIGCCVLHPRLEQPLADMLETLGYGTVETTADEAIYVGHNVLRCGTASPYARDRLSWILASLGYKVPEIDRTAVDTEHLLLLFLDDPQRIDRPLAERVEVRLRIDDPAFGMPLLEALAGCGFRNVDLHPLAGDEQALGGFRVQLGPLAHPAHQGAKACLLGAISQALNAQGWDAVGYPLQIEDVVDEEEPTRPWIGMTLPLHAALRGQLPPYAGPYPSRFTVRVFQDDPEGSQPLLAVLRGQGYRVLSAPLNASDLARGFGFEWGALGAFRQLRGHLLEIGERALHAAGVDSRFVLSDHQAAQTGPDGEAESCLYWPLAAAADGRLLSALSLARGFDLCLYSCGLPYWADLEEEFRGWGFDEVETRSICDEPAWQIRYGGAPRLLLDRIQTTLQARYGQRGDLNKAWDDHDNDIWIYLPERPPGMVAEPESTVARAPTSAPFDVAAWLGQCSVAAATTATSTAPRLLIEQSEGRLRIGPLWLPHSQARGGWIPNLASFRHYCLDQYTAETLLHLATSVVLREPCLLEGETSTSKTSSILYLAALLGQPVARLNLNGQSDAAELIGRYVPDETGGDLTMLAEHLAADPESLSERAGRLVARAAAEGRVLDEWETRRIAALEGVPPHAWRWQDGLIPSAMRAGWWVILDEVNLAEPQVLERLNSVLETEPTLVMSEHDNRVIGAGGAPCHPDFRIFATMNPAEYSGRVRLSPAYRDRWRGERFVASPGEREYARMLHYLVYGEQPVVQLQGRHYQAPAALAPHARLAVWPGIAAFLEALARFHVAVQGAAGQDGEGQAQLGARRKERQVFTRRALLSVLQYADSPLAAANEASEADPLSALRAGVWRYYLGRAVNAADRTLLERLLQASGLSAPRADEQQAQRAAEASQHRAMVSVLIGQLVAYAQRRRGEAG